MNKTLEAALKYKNKYGFSVIPVSVEKKALVSWTFFQKRLPTDEEIKKWWGKDFKNAGIALITGKLSGVSVIDLDTYKPNCENEAIERELPDTFELPTATTPREGRHLFFTTNEWNSRNDIMQGVDYKDEGGYIILAPSENGNGKKYAWTNSIIDFIEEGKLVLPKMPESLLSILKSILSLSIYSKNDAKTVSKNQQCLQTSTLFSEGRRDDDLFHVANCLIKGGMRDDVATQVLEVVARSCNPPFPEQEISKKIGSAIKRSERRDRNLAEEVHDYVLSTTGTFLSTDVYNCLQLSTREEKKNVSIILRRLCDTGDIEKYGNKNGHFRLIEEDCEPINFLQATTSPLDLKFPLGVERFTRVMPGNICVIAGASNSGKSGYLLSFTEMNMDKHDIFYFSSEMLEGEMKARLSFFDRDLKSWKFKPYHRAGNFADVIRPEAINIIDFLELGADGMEFYKVGAFIKEIFDKLTTGMAFIALQKNAGKDIKYGVGGQRSLEKARLYLSLDFNRLEITKGKNRTDYMINPDGKFCQFRLEKGCNFIREGSWGEE